MSDMTPTEMARALQARGRPPRELRCAHCQRNFQARDGKARFCSDACRQRARRARAAKG